MTAILVVFNNAGRQAPCRVKLAREEPQNGHGSKKFVP